MESNFFNELYSINVSEKIEQKNGLNYLSWCYAWAELKKKYPNATYTIERFGEDKKPYLYDDKLGYMVFTTMTINGLTHEMWLPVMDGANKSMKDHPYKYKVLKYVNGKKVWDKEKNEWQTIDKTVEPATMFDINKTIMRCLVKNIGMFGLGLYIYAGEDLPEEIEEPKQEQINMERGTLLNQIDSKLKELVKLGVDFKHEKTIQYIRENNNGKDDASAMTDAELYNYSKFLDGMINMKRGAKK